MHSKNSSKVECCNFFFNVSIQNFLKFSHIYIASHGGILYFERTYIRMHKKCKKSRTMIYMIVSNLLPMKKLMVEGTYVP